jgi:hypothetical protein
MHLSDIEDALRQAGLTPRGAFYPQPDDRAPEVAPGVAARTIALAGNAGPDMWRAFTAAVEPEPDSLDVWSKRVLDELATALGGRAVFPFDRPHLPFQRWACRAEPCHASPLGILVHPDYGLWHGYRGAIAFAERIDLPPPDPRPSPCETCPDRPCLDTCPVDAFTGDGYDVPACASHLASLDTGDCLAYGCRARRVCPVGRSYRYEPAQAQFHMAAFLRARRREGVVSGK